MASDKMSIDQKYTPFVKDDQLKKLIRNNNFHDPNSFTIQSMKSGLYLIDNWLKGKFELVQEIIGKQNDTWIITVYSLSVLPYSIVQISPSLIHQIQRKEITKILQKNILLDSSEIKLIRLPQLSINYESVDQRIGRQSLEDYSSLLGFDRLWQDNITGQDIVIAVVDTGVDFTHPSLVGKKFLEKSFRTTEFGYTSNEDAGDYFGHGTAVSSVIAGNSSEYRGVAYNSKIVNAKVGIEDGFITSAAVIAALDWASSIDEVDIINLSIGEPEESPILDIFETLVNEIVEQGKVVVASAGNNGKLGEQRREMFTIGSPGSSEEAITVGSINSLSKLSSFSSEGPTMGFQSKPDIVAPGENIPVANILSSYECEVDICYSFASGTSFSTPIISGISALLMNIANRNNVEINPGIMKESLVISTTPNELNPLQYGNGIVNASAASNTLQDELFDTFVYKSSFNLLPLFSIPQGEATSLPLTLISNSLGEWRVNFVNGNGSLLWDSSAIQNYSFEGYTHNLPIRISSDNGISPGNYSIELELIPPSGRNNSSLKLDFIMEILPKAKLRILLDLVHTPWDSVIGFNSKTRIDRLYGKDISNMLDLMNQNNEIWVNELLNGELNIDILKNYDILWIPSAFSVGSPDFFQHEINRQPFLTVNELFALHQFKLRGGKFLIDFGGLSENDAFFDTVLPKKTSLESFTSLFGIQISNVVVDRQINRSITNSNIPQIPDKLNFPIGQIQMEYGIPIVESDSNHAIMAYIGSNGDRSLLLNARNWRSSEEISFNRINSLLVSQTILDFLVNSETQYIRSWSVNQKDGNLMINIDKTFGRYLVTDYSILKLKINGQEYNFELSENDENLILIILKPAINGQLFVEVDLAFVTYNGQENETIDTLALKGIFNFDDFPIQEVEFSLMNQSFDGIMLDKIRYSLIPDSIPNGLNLRTSIVQGTMKDLYLIDNDYSGNIITISQLPEFIDLSEQFTIVVEIIDNLGGYHSRSFDYQFDEDFNQKIISVVNSTREKELKSVSSIDKEAFIRLDLVWMSLAVILILNRKKRDLSKHSISAKGNIL